MPRLLVINPNTTATMTQVHRRRRTRRRGLRHAHRRPQPVARARRIEGQTIRRAASSRCSREIERGERDGCAATVIACFDDPGVNAARCGVAARSSASPRPRCEAAAMVAARSPSSRPLQRPSRDRGTGRCAMAPARCAGVRAADISVLGLEHPTESTRQAHLRLRRSPLVRIDRARPRSSRLRRMSRCWTAPSPRSRGSGHRWGRCGGEARGEPAGAGPCRHLGG